MLSQVTEQPSGRLSGLFFIDYYHNAVRDENSEYLENVAIGSKQDVHGFQIRRIYLTYDYRFNSKFSSRFRLESDEDNFTSNLKGDKVNKFSMFVKDASINWNYSDGHNVIIGIQPTPAFDASESLWGNRYIEKTIMDLRKIVSTRDLAISFKGKIDTKGMFRYWLMYGNNSAGKPEDDKYKRYYAHLGVTPANNLNIALYTDYQSRESVLSQFDDGTLSNHIITTALFAGYNIHNKFSAGIEVFLRTVQNGFTVNNSYMDTKGTGISIFSTYHFSEKINVFGRFDIFEPNTHELATGDVRNLIIAGLAFKPESNFIISPNIFIESYENTDAGSIRSSVTPRLTVSWAF